MFGQGTFRNVYADEYTVGRRKGQPCVCKVFKTGGVFEDSFFESDIKTVEKTLHIVAQWNNLGFVDKTVQVNKGTVWTFQSGSHQGEKALVEPLIHNWQKFNSKGTSVMNPHQARHVPTRHSMQPLSEYYD